MLATLQMARKHFPIPESDTSEDENITFLLEVASGAIETYCKRTFAKQQYTQQLDGSGTKRILLSNFPIHSVESLTFNDEPLTGYEILSETGVLFKKETWPKGDLNIEVSYTAGYITPEMTTVEEPQTLPKPLELACILFAKQMFDGTFGIKIERLGDHHVEYAISEETAKSLPPTVIALISPYARRLV